MARLVSISLQGYTDAMIEYEYDSLIALDAGSEQEIKVLDLLDLLCP